MRRCASLYWRKRLLLCGKHTGFDLKLSIHNPLQVKIGNNTTINERVLIQACDDSLVIIGNNVVISYGAMLLTGGLDYLNKLDQSKHQTSSIIIEDSVWIGAGSIILPGVKIKKGAVVAAGSIVTKSVETNCVVGGNPAKLLKKLNCK